MSNKRRYQWCRIKASRIRLKWNNGKSNTFFCPDTHYDCLPDCTRIRTRQSNIKFRLHKARPAVLPSIKIHQTRSAIKGSDAKHCYGFWSAVIISKDTKPIYVDRIEVVDLYHQKKKIQQISSGNSHIRRSVNEII